MFLFLGELAASRDLAAEANCAGCALAYLFSLARRRSLRTQTTRSGAILAALGVIYGLGACAAGIHGCKSALIRALGRSLSSNMTRYSPQSTSQGRGDIEFSLSRLPTAQAPSRRLPKAPPAFAGAQLRSGGSVGSRPSLGAPVPEDPMNILRPSVNVMSRPLARLERSLLW